MRLTILRRSLLPLALVSLCFLDVAPSVGATADGSVSGQIQVVKGGKGVSDHSKVVVYLEGVPASANAAKRKHVIKQRNVQFAPQLSVIVKGTTVDFPNEDKIFHNVFSASRAARFDLGLYRSGASKSVDFKRAGVVDVFCNIHPEMISRVLVVPTHHYAITDASGKFRIDGVPPGTYPAVVWHPSGNEVRQQIQIQPGKAAALTAKVEEGEMKKEHRRKDGSPYGRYE